MSKRFRTQDYHRYKRLGMRWRKPKGRHSKLRVKKAGSGIAVSIGYMTAKTARDRIRGMDYTVVRNLHDMENARDAIIISSAVGAKKAAAIAEAAAGKKILNMKKIKKAEKIARELELKKKVMELKKKEKEKAEKEKAKEKEEKQADKKGEKPAEEKKK